MLVHAHVEFDAQRFGGASQRLRDAVVSRFT